MKPNAANLQSAPLRTVKPRPLATRSARVINYWQLEYLAFAALSLFLVVLVPCDTLAQTPSAGEMPGYELVARITMSRGYVKQAEWFDGTRFLTLQLHPDETSIKRTDLDSLAPENFISASFFAAQVCPVGLAGRVEWVVSPNKAFMFFGWFTDSGTRKWTMIDISNAPEFKIKRFTPPEGMQIAKVLFSPDDKYAVFIDDSFKEGSSIGLLAMDLELGREHWRVPADQLSFVSATWWGAAQYDSPKFYAVASLNEGSFLEDPGLFLLDVSNRSITSVETKGGVMLGSVSLWGEARILANPSNPDFPFKLELSISGQDPFPAVELSSQPISITMLNNPGYVLLHNTRDWLSSELWLVEATSGERSLIDEDCESYSVCPDGKLIVKSGKYNELRIYDILDS